MSHYLLLILFGVLSGVLAGMGLGGGTLLIPLLTLFAGVGQHQAQLYNLTAFIPTAIISIFIHRRSGLIKFKGLLPVVFAALITSALAGFLSSAIDGEILKRLFGGFLILLSAVSFIKGVWHKRYNFRHVRKHPLLKP